MERTVHSGPAPWIWIALFVVATLTLLAGGYAYYRYETERIRQVKYHELAAIATLKAGQIQEWRQERLRDLRRSSRAPLFRKAIDELLRDPDNTTLKNTLQNRLVIQQEEEGYANVLLLDTAGRILLSAKPDSEPLTADCRQVLEDARAEQTAVLSDLYRCSNGITHLDAVVPILSPEGRTMAVLVLRSNAESLLYPLIQSWPTPSRTAETLLVRREGEGVLFLNDLRHRPNTAFSLRQPLTRNALPAAQAVLGQRGIFQGKDYRGVDVLADLRPIPGSPWFMVAKVDASEILSEARYRGGVAAFFAALSILLAAGATAYGYRHKEVLLYQDLYRSERAKRVAQEEFRTTLYSIGDAVITVDTGCLVKQMNRVAEELTGRLEAEARGQPINEVFPIINEDSRAVVENPVHRVLREGAVAGLANHTLLIAKDGTERPIMDSGAPILDGGGTITGVVLVFRDQTEERAAQKTLADSKRRLAQIIEFLPDATFVVDDQGRVIAWNQAIEAMTGVKAEEMVGKGDYEYALPFYGGRRPVLIDLVLHPDDAVAAQYNYFRQEGERLVSESLLEQVEGRGPIWLWNTATPLYDQNGRVVGAIESIRDISDTRQAERECSKMEAQLQQAQKMEAVGTLAGGVAHDFNNLLQVILGYSDLILSDDGFSSLYKDDLERVRRAAQNGAELVQRLLTFSRKTEVRPLALNLNQRIIQVEKLLKRTISKMIETELILATDLAAINADPTLVEQVLMNLAVNARDAMPEGGKLVIETSNVIIDAESATAHLEAVPGRYVLLRVSDTGEGMDKQTLEHIFEPFFSTKGLGKGTGLGLAMVYGIVHQHGGFITCYSEPGLGTTFKIYLPALEGPPRADETAPVSAPAGGTETILLVDDEELIRELGARILTKAGYTVLAACNGKEALEVYRKEQRSIGLVVLDLVMPEMSGKQCLEELLRIDPHIKVLIASGYSGTGPAHDDLHKGAKGFVGKPFDIRRLLQVVRDTLDSE